MLPEELKHVLALSGGKIIVSEGDVKESYVVMKLDEYLREVTPAKKPYEVEEPKLPEDAREKEIDSTIPVDGSLTNEELLDRINADIALLRQGKTEKELEETFSDEADELDYDYTQGNK